MMSIEPMASDLADIPIDRYITDKNKFPVSAPDQSTFCFVYRSLAVIIS